MADIDLNELATTLDSEDMIGFTRVFVEDIRKGFRNVNLERYPWMEVAIMNGKAFWHSAWEALLLVAISSLHCVT